MRTASLTLVWFAIFSPGVEAQGIRSLSTGTTVAAPRIRLGMDQEDVHRIFGRPTYWFNLKTDKYIGDLSGYRASLDVYGLRVIADVYRRRTRGNLYEMEVAYEYDDSSSRLNPRRRVDRIIFEADHPAAIEQVLKDIPEVGEACAVSCYFNEGAGEVILVPTVKSKHEEEAVAFIDSGRDATQKLGAGESRFHIFLEWPSNIGPAQERLHQQVTTIRLLITPESI
jgi:hypothetical protein